MALEWLSDHHPDAGLGRSPNLSAALLGVLRSQDRPIRPIGRVAGQLRRWLASSALLESGECADRNGLFALVAEELHDLDQLKELHPQLSQDARIWIAVEPQSARRGCVASTREVGTWLSALHARGFATLSARPLSMACSNDLASDWARLPLSLRYLLGSQLLLIARPVPTGAAAYREDEVRKLLKEGMASEALRHCASVLRLDPRAPGPNLWWARALLAAGRGDEATEVLQQNLKRWPGDREAWRLMEMIREQPVIEGDPASTWVARHWLRRHAPSLVGPLLDIGAEPEQRSWLSSWAEWCRVAPPDGEDLVEVLGEHATGAFGSVVAWEPFGVSDRRVVLLEELLRVVRPGGQLLIVSRRVRASALKTVLEQLGATCLEREQLRSSNVQSGSDRRGLCLMRASRRGELSSSQDVSALQLYERASDFLASGQLERALALGQRLLTEQPLHHSGYLAAAAAWERMGHSERADALLLQGLEQQDEMVFCMRLALAYSTLEVLRR